MQGQRLRRAMLAGTVVGLLGLGLLAGPVQAHGARGSALLRDPAGNHVGVVRLSEEAGAVLVRAVVHDLAPGFHGFHVHAVGICDPAVGFTSAGGHFNPGTVSHGEHAGDLVPLLVNGDGTAHLRFTTDRFTIPQLFDADGSALIVHAGRDNLANIPTRYHSHTYDVLGPDADTLATGDAGSRAACGEIRAQGDV